MKNGSGNKRNFGSPELMFAHARCEVIIMPTLAGSVVFVDLESVKCFLDICKYWSNQITLITIIIIIHNASTDSRISDLFAD
jgi:hypothetical protein